MQESTQAPGKRCTACREVKPITEFTLHSKRGRRSYYRSTCRTCGAAYTREYTRERREFLEGYKLERGCADCGYAEHACALDFDHRPGEVKLFTPAWLKSSGSWQQMLDEIAKCDVVCSNCHRVRTKARPSNKCGSDLRNPAARPPRVEFGDDGSQDPLFPID